MGGDLARCRFRGLGHCIEPHLSSVRHARLPESLPPIRAGNHGPGGERHEGRRRGWERDPKEWRQSHRHRLWRRQNCNQFLDTYLDIQGIFFNRHFLPLDERDTACDYCDY